MKCPQCEATVAAQWTKCGVCGRLAKPPEPLSEFLARKVFEYPVVVAKEAPVTRMTFRTGKYPVEKDIGGVNLRGLERCINSALLEYSTRNICPK